jgi:hypothetical protein
MASSINADNGVVSGVSGLKSSADATGVLQLQTNGTTALTISTGQVVTLAQPLPASSGGTGTTATPTNGQVAIGNGTGFTLSTLTAGSGISISNGAGSITITNSSTGGAQGYIVGAFGIV